MISLRLATAEDAEFARQAHHKGYHDTVVKQFQLFNEEQQDDFFFKIWNTKPHWMIERDGTACGYVCFEDKLEEFVLIEFVIHPDFHGQGVGAECMNMMKEKAVKAGKPLRLSVLVMNTAYNFYLKQGLSETSRDPVRIYMEWRGSATSCGPR